MFSSFATHSAGFTFGNLVNADHVFAAFNSFLIIFTMYSNISYYRDFVESRGWAAQKSPEIFDFIVVGGGAAGCAVANRLSKHNKVLLLELGGNPNPLTSTLPVFGIGTERIPSADLMYETVPQIHASLSLVNNVTFIPRGVGLGGSGNLNSMIYQRGNPQDYDNWATITGNSEWTYQNLLPFFKKLEDYNGIFPNDELHGKGGPIHIEKIRTRDELAHDLLSAVQEKGYKILDLSGRQAQGFSLMDVNMKKGLRWSAFNGYIKPILKRTNLQIYRYSRVVKVHLDRRKHAYGVSYYRHGQRRFVRARKEIILSAGSIDSAKLLLLSGVGPKQDLHGVGLKCRLNLPVGRNFQDHVSTLVGPFLLDANRSVFVEQVISVRKAVTDFVTNGSGLLFANGAAATGFFTTSVRNDSSWPEIQMLFMPFGMSEPVAAGLERINNFLPELRTKFFAPYFGMRGNFVVQTLARPKSIGKLQLVSPDPFVMPKIQPNYLQHEDDIKAMIEAARIHVSIFENTTTYQRLNARLAPAVLPGCEGLAFKSDAYFECFIRHLSISFYHPVGTVAMGKSVNDSRAVLDSELRLLKATGLRVIDASVMPVLVNANTHIPSIMIGEVGSFFTRRYWSMQYEVCRHDEVLMNPHAQNEMCFYSRLV